MKKDYKNLEIQKKNQTELRELEEFYTTNTVSTMLDKIEDQKAIITNDIINFAETTRKPTAWNSDGDIVLKCNITVGGKLAPDIKYFHPTCCSLPLKDLKYDPYRKFKKGDIVRLKEWNGRCPEMYSGTNSWFNHPPRCKNGNLEVREDEKDSKVEIGIIGVNCAHAAAAPCFLELVTPVEEMEPYYIEEKDIEFQVRMKYEDKDCLISVFRFKNIVCSNNTIFIINI